MKKEITALLNSEKATLKLNQFCHLNRYQIDARGETVDKLFVEFNLTSAFSHKYEITSRNWRGIIEQVVAFQTAAFADACETLNTQIKNGYIG